MEMVISNHFPCKGLVHHPIDSQPFINGWPWGSCECGIYKVAEYFRFQVNALEVWRWTRTSPWVCFLSERLQLNYPIGSMGRVYLPT